MYNYFTQWFDYITEFAIKNDYWKIFIIKLIAILLIVITLQRDVKNASFFYWPLSANCFSLYYWLNINSNINNSSCELLIRHICLIFVYEVIVINRKLTAQEENFQILGSEHEKFYWRFYRFCYIRLMILLSKILNVLNDYQIVCPRHSSIAC